MISCYAYAMRWGILLIALTACGPSRGFEEGDAGVKADAASDAPAKGPDGCTAVEWAPDQDGDGYGVAYGTSFGTRISCTKPSDALPFGTWSSKIGDCADQDALAHPGAAFSKVIIAGPHPQTPKAYDFDCDGVETHEFPLSKLGSCKPDALNQTCVLTPGWYNMGNECGLAALYVEGCGNTIPARGCAESQMLQEYWVHPQRIQGCR